MTLNNQQKLAKHILRLLKVNETIFPICRTPKGNFAIRYSTSSDKYEMFLDSVPLSTENLLEDENNIELKRMLDKYLFESTPIPHSDTGMYYYPKPVAQDKPKRGRPIGSKNGDNKTEKSS